MVPFCNFLVNRRFLSNFPNKVHVLQYAKTANFNWEFGFFLENCFHLSKALIWMCQKKKPKKELSTSFHSSHWVLHVPISSERHNRFFMTCHQHKICFQKPFTLFPLFMKTALRFTQQQCTQIVDSVFQFDVSDILNISWQVYKTIENFWIYLKISMKFTQKIIIIFFFKRRGL